jgi:hypothetical protein
VAAGPSAPQNPSLASFALSNLSIDTSESRTWHNLTFVARYGEDARITLDVTNVGEQGGVYTAVLLIDGQEIGSKELSLTAGETRQIAFDVTGVASGEYTVQIGELWGDFTSRLWINWWLIAGFSALLVLLGWGSFYLVRRYRRGY